jgi:iron complex outermembrane receptor protein
MRAPRHRLRASGPIRRRAGAAPCLLALLLLAPAAWGQPEAPAGEAAESEASATDADALSAEAIEEPEPESSDAGAEKRVPLPAPTIEEIEVVGRRMKIEIPDATVSAVGFDPNELKAEGISDIRDLSNFTPSLEIKSAFAASNPTIFIRGVGLDDYNANAASAVAIYQDGVYMQSPAGQLFQFFDASNVTVLRGPQPTLFRNAEAGAILVNSREPTDELDMYTTATYGNYDLMEVEGAVGGPIVPDWLSGRVSAIWGIRDGITKNYCAVPLRENGRSSNNQQCNLSQGVSNFQHGMDNYTNNLDAYAGRGQLMLRRPVGETEMEWLANVHGGKNRSRAYQYQHRGVRFLDPFNPDVPTVGGRDELQYIDDDDDPFAGAYNIDGPENIDLLGTNLRGKWIFGEGLELRSLTAYEWHDRFTQENTDAGPKNGLESEYGDTAWQLSEQLDLRGSWDSLFSSEYGEGEWTLGAYYLQEDLDVENFFASSGTSIPQRLTQVYKQTMWNAAGYLQSIYRIRPGCSGISCDFTLLGGFRYNIEHKRFKTNVCEDAQLGDCSAQALPPPGNPDAGKASDTWKAPGGEISVAWDFTEESNLYLKYSHGWKGGHFNGGAVTVFDLVTAVEPETVDSYEAGLRSYWLDRRLMLNLTGFYYSYDNLQVFIIDQTDLGYPIPKLVNSESATVYGVELDLGAEPLPGLNLTYNFAWVESEYTDFVVSFAETETLPRPCRTCPPPEPLRFLKTFDYSGNPLIASPRFSMTGSAEYLVNLPGTLFGVGLGSLTPRLSFSWKDQVYFDSCSGKGTRCNFEEGFFGEDPYWVFNAALTWRSEDERFELMGWIHNFMDRHYKTQNFDLSEGIGVVLDAYADPRMYGITATISF